MTATTRGGGTECGRTVPMQREAYDVDTTAVLTDKNERSVAEPSPWERLAAALVLVGVVATAAVVRTSPAVATTAAAPDADTCGLIGSRT